MRRCLTLPTAVWHFFFALCTTIDDDDFPVLKINYYLFEMKCAMWFGINVISTAYRFPGKWISAECDMRLFWISFRWSCICNRIVFPFDNFLLFTPNGKWSRARPKHLLNFLCRTLAHSLASAHRIASTAAPWPRVRWSTNSMTCEISLELIFNIVWKL